jgi:hypothetical protein
MSILPKAPKIKTPAAAPVQPALEAPKQELGGDTSAAATRKRRGRSALRIDLSGGASSGLNIPTK